MRLPALLAALLVVAACGGGSTGTAGSPAAVQSGQAGGASENIVFSGDFTGTLTTATTHSCGALGSAWLATVQGSAGTWTVSLAFSAENSYNGAGTYGGSDFKITVTASSSGAADRVYIRIPAQDPGTLTINSDLHSGTLDVQAQGGSVTATSGGAATIHARGTFSC